MTVSSETLRRLQTALASSKAGDEITARLGLIAGDVLYVDSGHANAADVNDRTGTDPTHPFATLDFAIGKATASQGDVIVVMPGHAETGTGIALDVAGLAIVGLGYGRNRPAFTADTSSADLLSISAANCEIHNIRFVGAASGVTALVNIAAADVTLKDCVLEHGAAPLIAVTVPAASDRFTIEGCLFLGTADGPDVAVDFEGEVDHWTIKDTTFNYSPNGIDAACIRADANAVPGGLVDNCRFICVSAPFIDFDSSDSLSGDGLLSNLVASIGPTTTPANIDTAIDQGGYVNVNVLASKAVDDSGSRIPVATGA